MEAPPSRRDEAMTGVKKAPQARFADRKSSWGNAFRRWHAVCF